LFDIIRTGWFDSLSDKPLVLSESDATDGTTRIRFNANRKCALQTAINYWNEKKRSDDADLLVDSASKFNGHVVYAGLEPVEFTNLFPFWKVNENARNCNLNVNKILLTLSF
jgi:supervillin